MSFYVIEKNPGGHVADPREGTCARERDGAPASSLNEADYPVTAVCKGCGGRIRLGRVRQMEWRHVPLPAGGVAS